MAKFHIKHYRQNCIGCGNCAAICPENWSMNADGKSDCKNLEIEELSCNGKAAASCPVKVIHVFEGKRRLNWEECESKE